MMMSAKIKTRGLALLVAVALPLAAAAWESMDRRIHHHHHPHVISDAPQLELEDPSPCHGTHCGVHDSEYSTAGGGGGGTGAASPSLGGGVGGAGAGDYGGSTTSSTTGGGGTATVNHIQLENSNVASHSPTDTVKIDGVTSGCTKVTNRSEMLAAVEAAISDADGGTGYLTLCPGEIVFHSHEQPIDLGRRAIHVSCGGEPGSCIFRKV